MFWLPTINFHQENKQVRRWKQPNGEEYLVESQHLDGTDWRLVSEMHPVELARAKDIYYSMIGNDKDIKIRIVKISRYCSNPDEYLVHSVIMSRNI